MTKLPRESLRTNSFEMLMMSDIRAGMKHLRTLPFVKTATGFGLVGFCGGEIVGLTKTALSREIAAVGALYATPSIPAERNSPTDPKPDVLSYVSQIKVPLQLHYGTADNLIPLTDGRKFEQQLKILKVPSETFFYEGARHAFPNYLDQTYRPDDAKLAESRMKSFFKEYLR